jgi:hypothetical protein
LLPQKEPVAKKGKLYHNNTVIALVLLCKKLVAHFVKVSLFAIIITFIYV